MLSKSFLTALALTGMLAALLVLDIITPLAVHLGALYVIPLIFAFYRGGVRTVFITAVAGTLLIALGHTFPRETLMSVRITNRVLAVFALWVVAFFAIRLKLYQGHLQESARKLKRSNAELDHFSSIVSHDLRSHLAKVRMSAELLAPGEKLPETERKTVLESLKKTIGKMEEFISGLLDLARTSREEPVFEAVDLNALIKEIVEEMSVPISEKKARVEALSLPVMKASRIQMKQLFQNLISNSLKYSKPGEPPVVRIESRISGRGVHLSAGDNGMGFDEKDLGKLFEPFERLHAYKPGSGLGLVICRKAVDRHGGRITAHSRPGEGAVFYIDLPKSLLVKKA